MIKKFIALTLPKGYSKLLLFSMVGLSLSGIAFYTSASMNTNTQVSHLMNTAGKGFLFFAISYFLMVRLAHLFSFKMFGKLRWLIILGMLILLFVPRFFPPRNGAYNWIPLGFMTVQPSEFAKIVVILLMAEGLGVLPVLPWMSEKGALKKMGFFQPTKRIIEVFWLPFVVSFVYFIIVLSVQRDLGSAMVIFLIAMVIFFMAVHPFLKNTQRVFMLLLILGLGVVGFFMSPQGVELLEGLGMSGYQISRISSLYNLFDSANSYSTGFQQVKGLLSFSHGGLFGVGLGKSINKYVLPEAETDYILAIIVEELGFVAFVAILILYALMIFVLLNYSMKVKDERGRLFLIGHAAYLFFHFVINVGGVTVLIPLTGIPLLMLSQGGSSLLAIFITAGISQNIIARYETSKSKGR